MRKGLIENGALSVGEQQGLWKEGTGMGKKNKINYTQKNTCEKVVIVLCTYHIKKKEGSYICYYYFYSKSFLIWYFG